MTNSFSIAHLACLAFSAAMLHATATDLRHRRIRNWLVSALAVAWAPMALAASVPATEMAAALGAAALVFIAGVGCFSAGWLGGGDVKLAAAAVLWLGAGQALDFLLVASVLGGALAAVTLVTGRRGGAGEQSARPRRPVPYGPALAGAGLALLQGSPLAAAL